MSFPVFSKLGPSLRHREQQRAKELDACVTRTQSSPSVPLGLSRAREAQMERAGDATNGVAYERTAPLCHASMQDANEGSAEDRAVGRGTRPDRVCPSRVLFNLSGARLTRCQ